MKLHELLSMIQNISNQIGSPEPMVCGGIPRDRYMQKLFNVSDLDITNCDKTIHELAQVCGSELDKKYNIIRKTHDDGHHSIYIGSFKVDFSSNFNIPNIDSILKQYHIFNPTNIQREMYSRDFTCNALLLSLDFKHIKDPTNRGIKDINRKKIVTCLAPEITLLANKNRVSRAIYLSSKLDFDIDNSIIDFVIKNPNSIKIANTKTLSEKLNFAFLKDPDRAMFNISKMNLWSEIPITEVIKPYFIKMQKGTTTKLSYYQGAGGVNEPTPKKKKYKSDKTTVIQPRFKEPLYKNYDIYNNQGEHSPGSGYHDLVKYKSISDFLKARRKKLKNKYKSASLLKLAIDFPIDKYIDPYISSPVGDNSVEKANQIGIFDEYLTQDDFEGKSVDNLNFGRDYIDDIPNKEPIDENIEILLDKYDPNGLYGLYGDIDSNQEESPGPTNINPFYGTTDFGINMYEDKWNI